MYQIIGILATLAGLIWVIREIAGVHNKPKTRKEEYPEGEE